MKDSTGPGMTSQKARNCVVYFKSTIGQNESNLLGRILFPLFPIPICLADFSLCRVPGGNPQALSCCICRNPRWRWSFQWRSLARIAAGISRHARPWRYRGRNGWRWRWLHKALLLLIPLLLLSLSVAFSLGCSTLSFSLSLPVPDIPISVVLAFSDGLALSGLPVSFSNVFTMLLGSSISNVSHITMKIAASANPVSNGSSLSLSRY